MRSVKKLFLMLKAKRDLFLHAANHPTLQNHSKFKLIGRKIFVRHKFANVIFDSVRNLWLFIFFLVNNYSDFLSIFNFISIVFKSKRKHTTFKLRKYIKT